MKFEPDTEIDRLLRRHARRVGASSALPSSARETSEQDAGASLPHAGGAHLDTDEMNAYAEGTLPDATRSRYFAHLADCDECRGLVTKLTLAANVATAPSESAATSSASDSRSWREWLTALFTPPVLRYAVPALALLAVIAVAFVATRQRQSNNLVAQNEQAQSRAPLETADSNVQFDQQATTTTANTSAAHGADDAQNANTAAPFRDSRKDEFKAASPEQAREADAVQGQPAPLNEPPLAPAKPAPGGVFGRVQGGNRDEAASESKQQPPPPPVASAPAATPQIDDQRVAENERAPKAGTADEKNKAATALSSKSASRVAQDGISYGRGATGARATTESGKREQPAAAARRSRTDRPSSSADAAGPVDKDDRAAETRSAGGRQFRRQGGVWVDTAYNSPRGTINVARGSEQYRALVADEPGLRSIADQLGGPLIVVWKNRAYRIY